MLDTQIYDLIAEAPGMATCINDLSGRSSVLILSTHIQEDQLSSIPNKEKKTIIKSITRQVLPTSGAIAGLSRYDKSTFGDGSSGGFGVDEFRSPHKKHSEDALIATTAAKYANVLVTEDRRFKNRMKSLTSVCEVWDFNQFRQYIGSQST